MKPTVLRAGSMPHQPSKDWGLAYCASPSDVWSACACPACLPPSSSRCVGPVGEDGVSLANVGGGEAPRGSLAACSLSA